MATENETFWTDDKIAQLRGLWMEGHSTLQIGRMMQISKNAVIGKARRLRLPARPSPVKKAAIKTACTPAAAVTAREPASVTQQVKLQATVMEGPVTPVAKILAAAASLNPCAIRSEVTLQRPLERSQRTSTCQWPLGDPSRTGFRFCGDTALFGKPYCEAHCGKAFVKLRRADADQQQA